MVKSFLTYAKRNILYFALYVKNHTLYTRKTYSAAETTLWRCYCHMVMFYKKTPHKLYGFVILQVLYSDNF